MIVEVTKRIASIEVRIGPRGRTGASAWDDITGKPSTFEPSAHAATHTAGGADEITVAQSQVTGLASSLAGKSNVGHTHSQSDVTGLASALAGKSDVGHTHTQSEVTGLSLALAAKADLVDGLVPTNQIPAIAITEFLGTVSSQSAMLALTGQRGDWCNRSDVHKAYVAVAEPLSSLSNWAAIDYPAAPVLSVNGQAGTVMLGKSDVGLDNVDNTSDANKPISTAVQAALTNLDALYPSLTGSYANPSWITSLPWSKITGAPTTLAGYGITDAISDSLLSIGGNGTADVGLIPVYAGDGGLTATSRVSSVAGGNTGALLPTRVTLYGSQGSFGYSFALTVPTLTQSANVDVLWPLVGGTMLVSGGSYANPSWLTSLAASKLSGTVSNAQLANSAITINGTSVSLGGSISIATGLTIGSTAISGGTSGRLLINSSNAVGELALGTGVSSALGNAVNGASGLLTYSIIGTSGAAVPLLNTANTWSAAQTSSVNGAANTPGLRGTGTIFTGGTSTTTKPYWLIEPTGATSNNWSTSGTGLGINAASGFSGNLLDLQVNGSSRFRVGADGQAVCTDYSASGVLRLNPFLGSAGAYLTLDAAVNGRSIRAYQAQFYTMQGYQYLLANNWGDAADVGLGRVTTNVARITNGSTGRGTLDAAGYQVGGVAGASFGPGMPTSITVVNGIITAIS